MGALLLQLVSAFVLCRSLNYFLLLQVQLNLLFSIQGRKINDSRQVDGQRDTSIDKDTCIDTQIHAQMLTQTQTQIYTLLCSTGLSVNSCPNHIALIIWFTHIFENLFKAIALSLDIFSPVYSGLFPHCVLMNISIIELIASFLYEIHSGLSIQIIRYRSELLLRVYLGK